MTRKEAVEILEAAKAEYFGEIRCAFEIAINALNAKETSIERVAADYGLTVDGVSFALDQYQTVICEITNGRLSKLSYNSSDILSVANDVKCEGCELLEAQRAETPCSGMDDEVPCWYDITHTYTREQVWDALKSKEPMKFSTRTLRHGSAIAWTCGKCGEDLAPNNRKAKYCFNCGQAVRWNE